MTPTTRLIAYCGILGVLCAGGCNAGTARPNFLAPSDHATATYDIRNPGTSQQQRNQAVRFDPFPQRDIAPEIEDGRPRDYYQPLSETTGSRWTLGN